MAVETIDYHGYRLEVVPVGKGWRVCIYPPDSTLALRESPSILEKVPKEIVIAEAKKIVDMQVATTMRRPFSGLEIGSSGKSCNRCYRRELPLGGGERVEFPFPVYPNTLRHPCRYKLANDGHDTCAVQHYLGHKNIQHTVRYTELSPERFKSFLGGLKGGV
jgi:hypothetical protein